jgi:hypothetical protein
MCTNNGAGELFTIEAHACDKYAKKYKTVKCSIKKENVKKQQIICKIAAQQNIKPKGHLI